MTKKDSSLKDRIDRLFRQLATVETHLALERLAASDEPEDVKQGVARLLTRGAGDHELRSHLDVDEIFTESPDLVDYSGREIEGLQILERIGSGGTGDVYLAEDLKLKRRVAVKTIRGDWRFSEHVQTRFRREARILSRLDHPGICRIYNLIETGEADFLVLEYVEGRTLEEWTGENVPYRRKLRLAKRLLEAVSAAHNEQIVHRDLKLSNVMVLEDETVKVLDFGISRLLMDEKLSQASHLGEMTPAAAAGRTMPGAILGTLDFIAPEQARGEDVSTATDIYSLGIIFQSLFAETPAHPRELGGEVILDRARRGETEAVHGVPSDLTHLIDRMKHTTAAARPTAIEALATIGRIIDKPTRLTRWAAIAALVLAAGLSAFKYTVDLRAERTAAEQARAEAEQVSGFLVDLFGISDPNRSKGEEITARELLDEGAKRLEDELAGQPHTRIKLMGTIGIVYQKLGLFDESRSHLAQALEAAESQFPDDPIFIADLLVKLASTEIELRNYSAAEDHLLRAQGITAANDEAARQLGMDVREHLAVIYRRTERLDEALSTNLGLLEEQLGGIETYRDRIPTTYLHVGLVQWNLDLLEEAEKSMRSALSFLDDQAMDAPATRAGILTSLANVLSYAGKGQESAEVAEAAVRQFEEILDPDHPDLALAYDNLAVAHGRAGRYEEGAAWNLKAVETYALAVGTDHVDYAFALRNRAAFLRATDQLSRAEAAIREANEIMERKLGADTRDAAYGMVGLGRILKLQGRYEEAAEITQQAVSVYDASEDVMSGATLSAWKMLAEIHQLSGEAAQAQKELETLKARLQAEPEVDEEKLSSVDEALAALAAGEAIVP